MSSSKVPPSPTLYIDSLWNQIGRGMYPSQRDHQFSRLGLSLKTMDRETQESFAQVISDMGESSNAWSYDPEHQILQFKAEDKTTRAYLKPGCMRTQHELAIQQIAHRLGLASHFAPVVPWVIQPSYVPELTAQDLTGEDKIKVSREDIPLFSEQTLSGQHVDHLPKIDSEGEKTFNPTDKVKLPHPLVGCLSLAVESGEDKPSLLEFNKAVLAAAILGGRDLNADAYVVNEKGQVVWVDYEEFMAQNKKPDETTRTLGVNYLGKKGLSWENLGNDDLLKLHEMLENMPTAEELVNYIAQWPILFRDEKMEELGVTQSPQAEAMDLFVDKTGRESMHFPPRALGETTLFTQEQAESVQDRISNIRRAVSTALLSRKLARKFFKELPSEANFTAWSSVLAADSRLANDIESLARARKNLLRQGSGSAESGIGSVVFAPASPSPSQTSIEHWRLDAGGTNFCEYAAGELSGATPVPPEFSPSKPGRPRTRSTNSLSKVWGELGLGEDSSETEGFKPVGQSDKTVGSRTKSAPTLPLPAK